MSNALRENIINTNDDSYLFNEYKHNGSSSALDKLMEKYIHIPHSVAKCYALKGIEYDDLYQAACIGLLHAINNFDTSRAIKFTTYANVCVLGEVKHLFRQTGNYIKIPRRVYDVYYRAKKLSEEIVKETGNEPSKEELSIALNVSVEEVECAMTWGNNRIAKSLDYFIHEGEDMIYSDVLGLEDNSLLLLEDKMFLENCFKSLSSLEKQFLKYRYYDEMSQTDIASTMKISQMKVSRMEKKVLKLLKEMYENDF